MAKTLKRITITLQYDDDIVIKFGEQYDAYPELTPETAQQIGQRVEDSLLRVWGL